jgi:hypothetical protein
MLHASILRCVRGLFSFRYAAFRIGWGEMLVGVRVLAAAGVRDSSLQVSLRNTWQM